MNETSGNGLEGRLRPRRSPAKNWKGGLRRVTAKKHLLPYGMKLFLFYVPELILSVAFLFSQLIVRSVESLKQELLQSKINLADTYASLPENEFQPPEGISKYLSYY